MASPEPQMPTVSIRHSPAPVITSPERSGDAFFIDYPTCTRLKIWAESEAVELADNAELLAKVRPRGYDAVIERLPVFRIQAFDWNCQQHITPRFTHEEIAEGLPESR
jgi:uncharacterized protein